MSLWYQLQLNLGGGFLGQYMNQWNLLSTQAHRPSWVRSQDLAFRNPACYHPARGTPQVACMGKRDINVGPHSQRVYELITESSEHSSCSNVHYIHAIRSQGHTFSYGTIVPLSWHVLNCVLIGSLLFTIRATLFSQYFDYEKWATGKT